MKYNNQQGGLESPLAFKQGSGDTLGNLLGGIDSRVERAMRLKAVRSGTINLGYYARFLVKKKKRKAYMQRFSSTAFQFHSQLGICVPRSKVTFPEE